MDITPDHLILLQWGAAHLNATIVYTWVVMLLLVAMARGVTRRLSLDGPRSRWQNALEAIVSGIRNQVREVSGAEGSDAYLPFIGTLFLFIAVSNELHAVPGWHAPTGSLSTTAALAICVALSVPLFGIRKVGFRKYLHHYLSPVFFMLPIHMISEISRTVALAVRLFGNIMSGSMVVALLLVIAPLFFPVLIQALDLIIGLIQAYIFAILAMVYIAAAIRREDEKEQEEKG
ncbi:MAG: F0F1 ATP synthase subunit A [Bryobacterales bacterium]|nr:F0F1 ATP synthase subunit A [Bryobacterales bacterium]